MDDPAQALAYAAADFSLPDAEFVRRWETQFGPPSGAFLDLGCGPGNIAWALLARGECTVLGVDGAEAMLDRARARQAEQAGAADRVSFLRATLPLAEGTLPHASYAQIVSNSLLHHLHDPDVLWKTVRSLGAPGARILIGDLRRPLHEDDAEALVAAHAADAPAVLRSDFRASLYAAFTADEVAEQLERNGLSTFHVEAVGDRHLYVWGQLPTCDA
jgi:SAM-dependent methyltransferase